MADQATNPAERYKNAKVLDKAPEASHPAERYKGYRVVDSEEVYRKNIADATEKGFTESMKARVAENVANQSTGGKILDWFADAGRATVIGPAADAIGALYLSHRFKDKGITYKMALDTIRERHAQTKNTTATIAGALLGGGVVSSGMKKGAQYAATKSGMVDGALKWGMKDQALNRVVGAAAVGAGAGLVEEGIRTSLEETIDATGGYGFDTERVVDNMLVGSLLGGVASPALQESMRGGAWLFKTFGVGQSGQTRDASRRIIQAFANEGEDLDSAAIRMREKVQEFKMKHGFMPAAADIMKQEQVRDVADAIRYFNGLDIRARELGEEGVQRMLRAYDDVVRSGKKAVPDEVIRDGLEDGFTDVMKRNGKTMVNVPDDTIMGLMDDARFLQNIDVPGAKKMAQIVDLKKQSSTMRRKFTDLSQGRDKKVRVSDIADLRFKLNQMIQQAMEEGAEEGVGMSDQMALKLLIRHKDALDKKITARQALGNAEADLAEFLPNFRAAEQALAKYEQEGLKISLSDANAIRHTASRLFNRMRHADPANAEQARRIRDLVAPTGKAEVKEYANILTRWSHGLKRAEAQATGAQAAKGEIDLESLAVRFDKGRIPNKPKVGPDDEKALKSVQRGIREGAQLQLQKEAGGTTQQALASANRLSDSPNAALAISKAVGKKRGKLIVETADQVMDTYKSMKALASPRGATELAEERQMATDFLTGAVIGNMGGAGKAALLSRVLMRLRLPRGTAEKMVEMLGDPAKMEQALKFMQQKGIRVGPLFSATVNSLSTPTENKD